MWSYQNTALANPTLDGTRSLAMSKGGRASATGTAAAISNAAGLPVTPTFEIGPMYQLSLRDRTHSVGAYVVDSLTNPRLSVGLGYIFHRGRPFIGYLASDGTSSSLELSRYGHQVSLPLGVVLVPKWVGLGVTPKWQYTSLRYLDTAGIAHDAVPKLNAFGFDASVVVQLSRFLRISVVAENLVGNQPAAIQDPNELTIEGIELADDPQFDSSDVERVSNYPLELTSSLAVFPLGGPRLSLNLDGSYDFTSYRHQSYVRKTLGGSAEFFAGPIPIRVGSQWDSRGNEAWDDRTYVSGGIGYDKAAGGGSGSEIGVAVMQQIAGQDRETIIGVNISIRMNPER